MKKIIFSKPFIVAIIIIFAAIIGFLALFLIRPSSDWELIKADHTEALLKESWIPALEEYKAAKSEYPKARSLKEAAIIMNLKGEKYDTKDSWGNEMIYKASEDGKEYSITSYGADGLEGNKKVIKGEIFDVATDIVVRNGIIVQDKKANIIE